jgi:hypothetical protein
MAAIALAFAYVFRVAAAPHRLEESAAEVEGELQAEPLAT